MSDKAHIVVEEITERTFPGMFPEKCAQQIADNLNTRAKRFHELNLKVRGLRTMLAVAYRSALIACHEVAIWRHNDISSDDLNWLYERVGKYELSDVDWVEDAVEPLRKMEANEAGCLVDLFASLEGMMCFMVEESADLLAVMDRAKVTEETDREMIGTIQAIGLEGSVAYHEIAYMLVRFLFLEMPDGMTPPEVPASKWLNDRLDAFGVPIPEPLDDPKASADE